MKYIFFAQQQPIDDVLKIEDLDIGCIVDGGVVAMKSGETKRHSGRVPRSTRARSHVYPNVSRREYFQRNPLQLTATSRRFVTVLPATIRSVASRRVAQRHVASWPHVCIHVNRHATLPRDPVLTPCYSISSIQNILMVRIQIERTNAHSFSVLV